MKTRKYRAAGGVVLDGQGRVLMLERDVIRDGQNVHEVRLPKGHVDPGEEDADAAVREVCEESGYCDVDVVADLGEIHTTYIFRGQRYKRDEHYFLMQLRSDSQRAQDADPESEEALFAPVWASGLDEAEKRLTYASEQQFALRARRWIAEHRPA